MGLSILEIVIKAVDQATKTIDGIKKGLDGVQKSTKGAETNWRALFGTYMSALFLGMAMTRFFENTLRTLVRTYQEIMGIQNEFNIQVMAAQSAFTFLKFSIIDAFATSTLGLNLIDMLINGIDLLSQWIALNPDVAITGIEFGVIGAAMGRIISPLGQLGLLSLALEVSILFVIGAVAALIVGVHILTKIWTSDMDTMDKKAFSIIATVTSIGVAIALLAGSIPIAAFILGFGLIIAGVWRLRHNFALVGGLIAHAFLLLIRGFARTWELLIDNILGGINLLIRGYNILAARLGKPLILEISTKGKLTKFWDDALAVSEQNINDLRQLVAEKGVDLSGLGGAGLAQGGGAGGLLETGGGAGLLDLEQAGLGEVTAPGIGVPLAPEQPVIVDTTNYFQFDITGSMGNEERETLKAEIEAILEENRRETSGTSRS